MMQYMSNTLLLVNTSTITTVFPSPVNNTYCGSRVAEAIVTNPKLAPRIGNPKFKHASSRFSGRILDNANAGRLEVVPEP